MLLEKMGKRVASTNLQMDGCLSQTIVCLTQIIF